MDDIKESQHMICMFAKKRTDVSKAAMLHYLNISKPHFDRLLRQYCTHFNLVSKAGYVSLWKAVAHYIRNHPDTRVNVVVTEPTIFERRGSAVSFSEQVRPLLDEKEEQPFEDIGDFKEAYLKMRMRNFKG